MDDPVVWGTIAGDTDTSSVSESWWDYARHATPWSLGQALSETMYAPVRESPQAQAAGRRVRADIVRELGPGAIRSLERSAATVERVQTEALPSIERSTTRLAWAVGGAILVGGVGLIVAYKVLK